ncbi:hypothetical protein MCAP1_001622 [Malassezia caprae]|uniref:DNA-directed RNA polymerase III subunit RPC9 n=1 Tax=Malassezia caprae TaxID=1381934 RepID=A0AAF0E4K1_9BASI|nr:hypothetical protein MCAP1_001622 [Malassezia caprae]
MRVIKARAALLSDFEVLQLLKECEADQREDARNRKESGADPAEDDNDVPPNLRTIQFETIASLSQGFRPCSVQNAQHITSFKQLIHDRGYVVPDTNILEGAVGLTKAERLQLVNHAPASVVELHTIIEELGQRMSDEQIEDILRCISSCLPMPTESASAAPVMDTSYAPMSEDAVDRPDVTMEEVHAAEEEDAFPEEHFEHETAGAVMDQDDDE